MAVDVGVDVEEDIVELLMLLLLDMVSVEVEVVLVEDADCVWLVDGMAEVEMGVALVEMIVSGNVMDKPPLRVVVMGPIGLACWRCSRTGLTS